MKYVLALMLAILVVGCKSPAPNSNQQQGALSPSGRYVVKVPIEKNTTNPIYAGTPVWKTTILDPAGTIQYRDEESEFVGTLNVYWGWDSSDRLWLYNSDDGKIWRWELQNTKWQKIEGEGGHSIPQEIIPAYARKENRTNTGTVK